MSEKGLDFGVFAKSISFNRWHVSRLCGINGRDECDVGVVCSLLTQF